MSRGLPSLTALLGLLAVAGYQNRDKIAELIKGATSGGTPDQALPQGSGAGGAGGLGGVLSGAGGAGGGLGGLGGLLSGLGGAGAGGLLGGGLNDLVDRFRQSGQGDLADSWVGTGPNKDVQPQQIERAVGSDVLETLSSQLGLSREEIVDRLTRELPKAVDRYTPEGRLPTADDYSRG